MISQWWLYGRKWPSPPSAKKEIKSPKNKIVPRSLKFSKPPSYKTQGEGVGGVHTMENKDTNTDYQKIVRVGDQKWEIVESTFGIILFEIHIHYFLYREFSTPTPPKVHSNDPHLKCQFSPKITIWHKSLLYARSEKWHNWPPLPHPPGGGGGAVFTIIPTYVFTYFPQEPWIVKNVNCAINLSQLRTSYCPPTQTLML